MTASMCCPACRKVEAGGVEVIAAGLESSQIEQHHMQDV